MRAAILTAYILASLALNVSAAPFDRRSGILYGGDYDFTRLLRTAFPTEQPSTAIATASPSAPVVKVLDESTQAPSVVTVTVTVSVPVTQTSTYFSTETFVPPRAGSTNPSLQLKEAGGPELSADILELASDDDAVRTVSVVNLPTLAASATSSVSTASRSVTSTSGLSIPPTDIASLLAAMDADIVPPLFRPKSTPTPSVAAHISSLNAASVAVPIATVSIISSMPSATVLPGSPKQL